jgi:hypothetical protein
MENKSIDRHFGNFFVAGFTYWEGCIALDELKIGTQLRLEREPDNRFDPQAVAIYYGDYKLGYVPREENRVVCKLMDLGYADIFDLRVQRISCDAHPEKQLGVVLFINEANKVYNK